jgi:hypothetical protein
MTTREAARINSDTPRATVGRRIAALLDAGADDAAIVAAIAAEFPTTKFALDPKTAKQNLAWYKNAWRKARGLPTPPRARRVQPATPAAEAPPPLVLDDTIESAHWIKESAMPPSGRARRRSKTLKATKAAKTKVSR